MPRHKSQATDPDNLTPQQRLFVEHYLTTLSATEAYRKAGYKGARNRDARVLASQILSNPNVQNAIRRRMQSYALAYGAERERLIQRVLELAFGDPEYYERWGVKGPPYILKAADLLGRWLGMEQPQPQGDTSPLERLVQSIEAMRQSRPQQQ